MGITTANETLTPNTRYIMKGSGGSVVFVVEDVVDVVFEVVDGGLDWGIEDFDRFYAHIFPRNTHLCEHFTKRTPFAIRGDGLLIYASCVAEISQAHSALKGVS